MDVLLFKPIVSKSKRLGTRADIGDSRLDRLTHHFLKLTCHAQFAFPLHRCCFNRNDIPPDLGPYHACSNTHFIAFFSFRACPFRGSEIVAQVLGCHFNLEIWCLFGDDLPRNLSHDGRECAFKVSHASLTRILVNHLKDGFVCESDIVS